MALPEQVRRQVERATELLNQANGTPGDPAPAPAAPEPAPAEPQVPAPVEPQAAQPQPAAPAEPTPQPPAPPVVSDWEQKYRTLQGVFNAEQGRWQAKEKVLEARLTALEQSRIEPPAPAPAPAPLVTDKDIETYGPEMMDVIGRKATEIAQQIVAQQMAAQKPELDKINQQVSDVSAQVYRTSEDKFYGELTKAVPDWEQVNGDQRFLAWLAETDPLSGIARQVFLDNAGKSLDHNRAAKLFTTFKEVTGQNAPAPAPAPAAPAFSPSPRTVGNASAPTLQAPANGVRRSEIAAHYRRGSTDTAYRGSAEHAAFEVRMQQAVASNQIIEA